nr:hypothetical protein [Tanacetum cinerariifolium]
SDFEDLNGGYVAFGGNLKGVSQMCDKKNNVLFTDTECLVLSSDFKLPDASQVLLRIPRENNMYNVNLKNIIPSGHLTCLFAQVTFDESNLWHRRLGHVNFKTINKLVKGNLVRGLPSKVFTNDLICVAYKKGKQHRASCKSKSVSSIDQPLFRLHMDLFGPTFVKSLSKKSYCLVVTDDYSRFSWVFFLATKDETVSVLKTFIVGLENLVLRLKGIKTEFSVPRTPQQNGIAERKNRTLIEAARTLLADSLLPIPFWAEAVNTACYVQNRANFKGRLMKDFLLDTLSAARHLGFPRHKKVGKEGNQPYVLFPMLFDGSTNPKNTKDAHTGGNEHNDDIQKSVSPDIHSSRCGDQAKEQGDKAVNKDKRFKDLHTELEECTTNSSNGVNAASSSVSTAGIIL